jgi:Fe2+ or Zn2+ uptake regulation protein
MLETKYNVEKFATYNYRIITSMPVKRINFDVQSFIQTLNLSSFSITKINEAYLKHDTCQHTNPKTSKQYLYRNINKLLKIGFLTSVKRPGTNVIEYQLSNHKPVTINNNPVSDNQVMLSDAQICDVLREKLKHSKLSLLTSIGETEAYKECVEEIPTLQSSVQTKYNLARDNTSKLLGKVNAYESLLKLYE